MEQRLDQLNIIPGLAEKFSKEESLAVFEKMYVSRSFEYRTKDAHDAKHIRMPIYLSAGQEAVSSALSLVFPGPAIFAQHRAHDLYLAYGGRPSALVDELLHKPTGCAHGMGGSASIHAPEINMYGHSGLLGDQVAIAAGFAQGSNKRTLSVMGDAAMEEDYVLAAFGYAAHKKLPMLFVCIDNNLSVLTEVKVRRSWKAVDVVSAFGLPSVDIADDPWLIMYHAKKLANKLPAFMNIHVCRHLWHAGTGKDGEPRWDRLALVRQELMKMGYEDEVKQIEKQSKTKVDGWWDAALSETVSKKS